MFKKLPLKQMLQIIKSHIFSTILIFILGMVSAGAIYGENSFLLGIFLIISIIIYFGMMYSEAYIIAKRDTKKITVEEPYLLKGFLLPLGLTVLTVLFYLLYFFVWKYMMVGESFNLGAWLLNMIFIIWTYPFNPILGLSNGAMMWYGYIIVVFAPVIFSGIGYIAGMKDFDITAKLSKYIYEKKD